MSSQVGYRNTYVRQHDNWIDLFRVDLFGQPLEADYEVNIAIAKTFGGCTLANLSETTEEIVRVTVGGNLYRVNTRLNDLIECWEPGAYIYQIIVTGPDDFRLTVVEGWLFNEGTISTT